MIPTELGKLIKQIRKQKGYTQDQLAAALGVSQSAIVKYEGNLAKPGHDFIKSFREKLGFDLVSGENITKVVNQEMQEEEPQYGDLESRRTLERTLENMSEDKIRSTAIIERLVTLLEKSFSSTPPVKVGQAQAPSDIQAGTPSSKQDLTLGRRYHKADKAGQKGK